MADNRFTSLGNPARIWCISAINGNLEKVTRLHDAILPHITIGDRIIYTGNYIGYGEESARVIDEMLAFRRAALAKRGMVPSDFVYLRGSQEEMWQKLIQLQFSPDPTNTLLWMLANGLDQTLYAYGLSPHDGIESCRQGMVSISSWTNKIRAAIKSHKGHEIFTSHLVRAAYTPKDSTYPMLFVNAGIDQSKSLTDQGDSFWWAPQKFDNLSRPYAPFKKIVRGYDPKHKGIDFNCIKATIDGGCGFGGTLTCAVFDTTNGEVIDSLEC